MLVSIEVANDHKDRACIEIQTLDRQVLHKIHDPESPLWAIARAGLPYEPTALGEQLALVSQLRRMKTTSSSPSGLEAVVLQLNALAGAITSTMTDIYGSGAGD